MMKCDLCGREFPDEKLSTLQINGDVKNICEGCATAVKGLA